MALGDLYEVLAIGDFNGVQILQAWQYESLSSSSDGADLATRFSNQVLAPLSPLLHTSMAWNFVRARNLYNPLDDYIVPSAEGGESITDALPIFNAFVIDLFHDRPDIRDGRKSVAGGVESEQASGVVNPTTLISLDAWVNDNVLPGIIGAGASGLIYQPVIVKRIKYTTVSGGTAYRLPNNSLEAQFGVITGGATKARMSTQNTRKSTP